MTDAPTPQATLLPACSSSDAVHCIDPLGDARWAALVNRDPRSSVFHSPPWLDALHRTYGFQPVVYTTSEPDSAVLENVMVFCRVRSWITGRRLVSLPFSDHCEPLVRDAAGARSLTMALEEALCTEKLRYVELRAALPIDHATGACLSTRAYCFHEIDLRPSLDALFANLHQSSTQRKVQRAEREGLICECGHSEVLLNAFWDLLLLTRQRHGVPPQPRIWFQNLIDCFGEALQIRVAFQARRPAAAILTIRHKDTLVYKYGCSDTSLNHLGGTQLLFWRSIQEAVRAGLRVFDLGRSDCDNSGLITFKDRLGATRSTITYSRYSPSATSGAFGPEGAGWGGRLASRLAPRLPSSVLRLAGRLLYRHIA